MAYESCTYHYEPTTERVQEIEEDHAYHSIEMQQQTQSEPQPSATAASKDKSRNNIFVTVVALLVILGLAVGGMIFVFQEKARLDETKKAYEADAAELRGQDQSLNKSFLEMLESEIKELREVNREFTKTSEKQLTAKIEESSRVLQQMIQSQASKQNQTNSNFQRLIQDNEMRQNRTHKELLRGATSCAELRDKYGISESGTYQLKQNDYSAYSYCDFQLHTGDDACENLLNGLGTNFVAGYFWIRVNQAANPSFKYCHPGPTSCNDFEWFSRPISAGRIVNIFPTPGSLVNVKVYCDQDGWTVFQRRKDGSVNFYRGWDDYSKGFGDMNGEFWLGLKTVHQLTKGDSYELQVDLEDFYGNKVYAKYGLFSISSGSDEYRLSVSSYSGNAGNSLALHNGMRFTTKDNDNDRSNNNCANLSNGAWWFNSCHQSNLNGKYHKSVGFGDQGVTWEKWKNTHQYLKFTEIKFRKKN